MSDEKICFVIAPIGEPDSETRRRSDQILKHVISPAVVECGYKPLRADQIAEPGLITSQVIQHIVDDPLVVADLTERNPNVFYELAVRHAIRKPLVQIIKKGEQIPFDVAGTRTIPVDHKDLDSVENARIEIVKQIRAIENKSQDIDSPISVSLDLQMLRQSENPEQRSLADILSAIAELRASVSNIESKLEYIDRRASSRELFYVTRPQKKMRSHPPSTADLVYSNPPYAEETKVVIDEEAREVFRQYFEKYYQELQEKQKK